MEDIKGKSVYMLNEHPDNKYIADALKEYTGSLIYEVWENTDLKWTIWDYWSYRLTL